MTAEHIGQRAPQPPLNLKLLAVHIAKNSQPYNGERFGPVAHGIMLLVGFLVLFAIVILSR